MSRNLINDEQLHFFVEQAAAVPDVDGRLDLVAREDPELNAGALDVEDSAAYVDLELVLDRCRANQIELDFELLGDLVDGVLPVH